MSKESNVAQELGISEERRQKCLRKLRELVIGNTLVFVLDFENKKI